MPSGKSTGKSTNPEIPVGALIPQPHGGAIRNGGTNIGGSGRPPSELRDRLIGSFAERVHILEEFADGEVTLRMVGKCEECGHVGDPLTPEEVKAAAPQVSDRIRAIETLAKYGIGKPIGEDDVRMRLSEQIRIIQAELPADVAEALLGKIEGVWR